MTETTQGLAPLSERRRLELVEELIHWASDAEGHDWDRVDADDPFEPDGYTP